MQDNSENTKSEGDLKEKYSHELASLRLYYESILSTLEPGVLVLDFADTVITENDKVLKLWNFSGRLAGKKLQETELWQRCPELQERLAESRSQDHKTVRFECAAANSNVVTLTIKPILAESGAGQVGTLIYMENATSRVALQSTMEELETTSEELQASNEELETTNEELQSTNEELETTNEELQSTNEELETTNEELQSLNEELETTNEELSARSRELDEVNARYMEMMERMPWPVLLIDEATSVHMFNSAAHRLFGFALPSEQGMKLHELPLNNTARQAILRRHRMVIQTRKQSNIKNCRMITNRFDGVADVRFTPLSTAIGHDVIVMFQVGRENKSYLRENGKRTKPKTTPQARRKKSAKKKTSGRKKK